MMTEEKKLFGSHGGGFVDPDSVGSAVQYRINVHETTYTEGKKYTLLRASVGLSDCTRWITWELEEDTGEEKLNEAIKLLKTVRDEFIAAKKIYKANVKRTKEAGVEA